MLDTIGQKYGTDKSSLLNDYLPFYDSVLSRFRSKQDLRLLEIGVHEGASLRMWEEYFPHASLILGMDVNPNATRFAAGRISVELADQSDAESLVSIGRRHGPFDIVLDDGSHIWHHQIGSLRHLFQFVAPGGVYVVEDLATSFGWYVKEYNGGTGCESPAAFLVKLATYVVGGELCDFANEQDPFIRSAPALIKSINFHRWTAIIERKR